MNLKALFDSWGERADESYTDKQWLLSKWEVVEGVEWSQEKIDIMLDTIVSGLNLNPQCSLIDLGCGGGWIMNALSSKTKYIAGLDFSMAMLRKALVAYPDSIYISGDIGNLPFKDCSWDRALSYFVFLNFMDDKFVEKAILDIMRILKPGGSALLGQLPERTRSCDYEESKESYLEFCRKNYSLGKSHRDTCRAEQKLFDKEYLKEILVKNNISHQFRSSFNPFYREGQSKTIEWRFDLVLIKE